MDDVRSPFGAGVKNAFEQAKEQPIAELHITMLRSGAVQVQGPINQRLLCYGLLGMARDVVYETSKAEDAKIQPASLADIANVTGPRQ